MGDVVNLTRFGPIAFNERKRLVRLFGKFSETDLRRFWDGIGDDSFYHGPEGSFDCADIHGYMNMTGDGDYCAV